MFRWNGGSASFRKKLLKKMPEKNNKVIVSKYFSKNQNSNKEINHAKDNKDNLNITNRANSKYTMPLDNQQFNIHTYREKASMKNSHNEQNIKLMLEPSDHEAYPLTFNTNDILMVDPSYIKIFNSQEDKHVFNSVCQNYNAIVSPLTKSHINKKDEIDIFHNESINNKMKNDFVLNSHFSISNQTIFHKVSDLRDAQTQTNLNKIFH